MTGTGRAFPFAPLPQSHDEDWWDAEYKTCYNRAKRLFANKSEPELEGITLQFLMEASSARTAQFRMHQAQTAMPS